MLDHSQAEMDFLAVRALSHDQNTKQTDSRMIVDIEKAPPILQPTTIPTPTQTTRQLLNMLNYHVKGPLNSIPW